VGVGADVRRSGAEAAASVLVLLVWALGRPDPLPGPPACAAPREARCVDGWTVWVSCDPQDPFSPLRGSSRLLFGQRLDLNRAPPQVLEVLPGIGPARAAALAEERIRRPFASLAEVERVHGIGPATAAGLRGWAEVDPGRPAAAAGGCGSWTRAPSDAGRATAESGRDRKNGSQLLPKQNENSYKRRASPARRAQPCGRVR